MTMTVGEFTTIFQFVAQLFYGAFKALDTPIYTDGTTSVSLLTLFLGLFIVGILIEKIIDWIQGV